MFRKTCIIVLSSWVFLFPQSSYSVWIWADAESGGDGSESRPYKYLSEINIPSPAPQNVYINIKPAVDEYTINNSQDDALLRLNGLNYVEVIRNSGGNSTRGDVVFNGINGDDSLEYGIRISGCSTVVISGITFKKFNKHGIYSTGSNSQVGSLAVYYVTVTETIGISNDVTSNYAGIRANKNEAVTIKNCNILLKDNVDGQTDGLYLDSCQNIIISNNNIELDNRLSTSHVDCIQAYKCTTLTITNNFLKNYGESPAQGKEFTDRSGIIINETRGILKYIIILLRQGKQII
jgi:hypothetical protein